MHRKEARSNMRFGLLLTALGFVMLSLGFIWATVYLSASHVK
jgi:hypothetical protein